MSLSRRALFAREPRSSANLKQLISARGREALIAELGELGGEAGLIPAPQNGEIRLTSNENPLGPFPASMAAIHDGFAGAGRYPSNAQPNTSDLTQAIADRMGCSTDNIVLGAGSGELLVSANAACGRVFGRRGEGGRHYGGRHARPRRHGRSRPWRRVGLLLQPEQPDRHRTHRL